MAKEEYSYYGVLQPFSDALKLILKETIIPSHSNKVLFYLAPISTLVFSLLGWAIIPFGKGLAISDFSLGILYTLALSSLGVIGLLFSVWLSNSKWLFKKYNLACKQNKDDKIKITTQYLKSLSQKRYYSTNNTTYSILNDISASGAFGLEEFAHWFSGFCDAESNFYISDLGNSFSFYFNIKLHLDNIKLLQCIKHKLEIGKIYTYKKTCTFRISKYEELQKLFNILEIKPLNTTKYLNYLAFKKGLLLYYNNAPSRSTNLSLTEISTLFNNIRELKNSMNTLRTNFVLPNSHKILITPYWLLGFIEGDGSFSVSTLKSFPIRFNIVQAITEKNVLEAIKLFLLELPGNFKTRKINSNPVQILEQKESKLSENRKLVLNLNINDHSFLINILVPFFNKLNFLTKKESDYKDWRNILELKTHGWHLSEEGANLIVAISSHMNNNRLSSNMPSFIRTKLIYPGDCKVASVSTVKLNTEKNSNLLLEKVKDLLSRPSNFELYPDGKIFIKSEQKFWKGRGNVEIEVYDKEGLLLYYFDNLEITAIFFNVNKHIIRYRLNSGKSLILPSSFESKEVYFKRSIRL
jgi:hypothetical protein